MSRRGPGPRRGLSNRALRAAAMVMVTVAQGWTGVPAEEPAAEPGRAVAAEVVEFTRVRVPPGKLQDIPVGTERHVPLSAAEFDRALARLGTGATNPGQPRGVPAAARYELRPDAAGGLAGRVVIEVRDAAGGRFLRLGAVRSAAASVRTARGQGPAVVFGMPDGQTALVTPEPGTYTCEIGFPARFAGDAPMRLPLVGSLTTTIVLENLPARSRPVVSITAGRPIVRRVDGDENESSWTIEVGSVPFVDVEIVDGERPVPRLAAWTRASVRGSTVEIATRIVPAGPWHGDEIVLTKSPALKTLAIRIAGTDETLAWRETDEGRELRIAIPADVELRATSLVVEAIGPAVQGRDWAVPAIGVGAAAWGGGGIVVTVDPTLVIANLDLSGSGYRLVTPEVASRWPLPEAAASTAGEAAVRMHFELQRASGDPRIVLRPRSAAFDVARVTTVELARERVVGRAACDVRVVAGEAFGIEGTVMPGWVIDSVEAVDWDAQRELRAADPRSAPVNGRRSLEWNEIPARAGVRTLRIALDTVATPSRGVGLRISGHRLGVQFDAPFPTGDMDMVRLVGEADDTAVVDFRPAPDALVEVGAAPLGLFDVSDRLLPLVEEPAPRGRIRGGSLAVARKAVLVRRRPPLDADVGIDLTVREEMVSQMVRIACQATATPLESIMVHFSEPMGPDLAWQLVSPDVGGLVARRVEAADPLASPRDRDPVESWLVEFSPPVVGSVRVRASREVSVTDTVPVPLAWVEAANRPGGTVTVRGEGTSRPTVRNRRLRELPPSADAQPGTVAEFTYVDTDRPNAIGSPAAEVLPPQPDAEARGWAWHEESAVWCHDSGTTEIESRFDIENHGRDAVTLTPLPGRRLQEVLIDGRPIDLPSIDSPSRSLRVPLPAGRTRFTLEIRAVAEHVPRLGCWWIETSSGTIDLPVLDRRLRLLLPPGLEAVIVGGRHREVGVPSRGWRERLFTLPGHRHADESTATPDRPVGRSGSLAVGFRSLWFVPTTRAADAIGIGIVRRRLLEAAAIVSAWLAIVAVSFSVRRSRGSCIMLCAGAAIAALWMPAPFDLVTRVTWWASVAGALVAVLGRRFPRKAVVVGVVAMVACVPSGPAGAAEAPAPLRVFVMGGAEGDDVLVPERLFRLLAAATVGEDIGLRVIDCRVRADVGAAAGPWMVEIDVDADLGGRAVLDQRPSGARWLEAAAAAAAVTVGLDAETRVARLTALAAGRQTVRLTVQPAVERRGDLEFITACVPPAARAALECVDDGGRRVRPAEESLQCEVARRRQPFLPVAAGTDGGEVFDISGASEVRLVRPADRRDRLVACGLRGIRTINEVSWGLDACRLQATFEIDPGTDVLRSFVVNASPGLVPQAAQPGPAPSHVVMPLGAGRFLVELRQPRRGAVRVQLGFLADLIDPVGTFTIPQSRVEAAVSEVLEVRVTAAADLDVDVEPPAVSVPVVVADGESPSGGTAWRTERNVGNAAVEPRAQLAVRRKPQPVRATQRLAVEFAADRVGLQLRAKLDASTTPLGSIIVDVPRGFSIARVAVFEDDVLDAGAADRGPLDVEWKQGRDGLMIVAQQPRAGRFRLEVDAGQTKPPAARGPVPILRARMAGGTPLTVEWRQPDGIAGGVRHTAEVPADGMPPRYELVTTQLPTVEPPAIELPKDAAAGSGERRDGVLLSRVHVALDDAGRLRGVDRFDLLTGSAVVRLRLPPRTRLLDVLVDGREVQVVPEGQDAWGVRLHDSLWPRSVSVVFRADIGPRGPAGQVRLAAPTIDGLRGPDVLWTIDPPPAAAVRIAEPARLLTPGSWQENIRAAEAEVVDAFGSVIAATPEPMRERYRSFAATLASGPASRLEASWDDSLPRLGGGGGRVHAVATADGTIPCRIDSAGDDSLPARAALTAALAAVIGLGRAVAVRARRSVAAG
ncbi:MAG: hypothetical protein ACK6CT_08595 [Planctomycetia bacterium]